MSHLLFALTMRTGKKHLRVQASFQSTSGEREKERWQIFGYFMNGWWYSVLFFLLVECIPPMIARQASFTSMKESNKRIQKKYLCQTKT